MPTRFREVSPVLRGIVVACAISMVLWLLIGAVVE